VSRLLRRAWFARSARSSQGDVFPEFCGFSYRRLSVGLSPLFFGLPRNFREGALLVWHDYSHCRQRLQSLRTGLMRRFMGTIIGLCLRALVHIFHDLHKRVAGRRSN
jgi:hypothetical protein